MKSIGSKIIATGMAAALTVAPTLVRALPQKQNPFQNIPVSGSTDTGQQFAGTLDIQRFEQVGSQIVAIGVVSGKLAGDVVKNQAVAIPLNCVNGVDLATGGACTTPASLKGGAANQLKVTPAVYQGAKSGLAVVPAQQVCPILDLVLGPIHLDLLGLVVDLNRVHLQITAESGAGNLLGNLLCAVANLLNPPNLGGLTNLLNQIVNILNGIIAALP